MIWPYPGSAVCTCMTGIFDRTPLLAARYSTTTSLKEGSDILRFLKESSMRVHSGEQVYSNPPQARPACMCHHQCTVQTDAGVRRHRVVSMYGCGQTLCNKLALLTPGPAHAGAEGTHTFLSQPTNKQKSSMSQAGVSASYLCMFLMTDHAVGSSRFNVRRSTTCRQTSSQASVQEFVCIDIQCINRSMSSEECAPWVNVHVSSGRTQTKEKNGQGRKLCSMAWRLERCALHADHTHEHWVQA